MPALRKARGADSLENEPDQLADHRRQGSIAGQLTG
jgi:hypothetical protein